MRRAIAYSWKMCVNDALHDGQAIYLCYVEPTLFELILDRNKKTNIKLAAVDKWWLIKFAGVKHAHGRRSTKRKNEKTQFSLCWMSKLKWYTHNHTNNALSLRHILYSNVNDEVVALYTEGATWNWAHCGRWTTALWFVLTSILWVTILIVTI